MDDSVSLSPYDPSWPACFQYERTLLLAAAGSTIARVEHVGSSAVPHLVSRPCIDILVGIRSRRMITHLHCTLTGLGYQCSDQRVGRIRGFDRIDELTGLTYQIHPVKVDDPNWRRYLEVRDYLRRHPDEVRWYGLLKEVIAPWGPDLYRKAKMLFFWSIVGGTE